MDIDERARVRTYALDLIKLYKDEKKQAEIEVKAKLGESASKEDIDHGVRWHPRVHLTGQAYVMALYRLQKRGIIRDFNIETETVIVTGQEPGETDVIKTVWVPANDGTD